jgi:hypothetical protein
MMSFGKRTRPERKVLPSSPVEGDEHDDSIDEDDQPSVPRWQWQVLTFVGVVLAFFSFAKFALPVLINSGGSLLPASAKNIPNVADQLVIELPVRDVTEAAAKSNEALRRACFHNEFEVSEVPAMFPGQQLTWQITDPASSRIYHSFSGSPDVLSCLLTNEMPRFCDSNERKKMTNLLTTYATGHRHFAERYNAVVGSAPAGLVDMTRDVASMTAADGGEGVTTGSGTELSVSAALLNAINLASETGYLSSDDFASSVPAELEPFFTPAKSSPCN